MNPFPQQFHFPFASALLMTLAGALPLVGSSDADAAGNAAFEEPSPVESEPILPRNKETPLVTGGTAAAPKQFPWMAGIINVSTGKIICGATLIAPRAVLTSARCVTNLDATKITVLLGDIDTSTETESPAVKRAVGRIDAHANFSATTSANDIAILRLSEPAPLNLYIRPIALAQSTDSIVPGRQGTILGWGTITSGGSALSPVLQSLSTTVILNAQCAGNVGRNLTGAQICTWSRHNASSQFDAGGPLAISQDGKWILAGIINAAVSTTSGEQTTLHTRIDALRPWIDMNLSDMTP